MTPEQIAKGRLKNLERRRIRAKKREEMIGAEAVGSKWRLMEGQEWLAELAREKRKNWRKKKWNYERAARATRKKNAEIILMERQAEKEKWPWAEQSERILPARNLLMSLKEDEVRQLAAYEEAEAGFREVMREMGRFAEAAAPYFDPKLMAVDAKITGTTTVQGTITHEHRAHELLNSCAEAINALVGGGLGSPPRRLRADSAGEPLHPTEALPKAADVPDGDRP